MRLQKQALILAYDVETAPGIDVDLRSSATSHFSTRPFPLYPVCSPSRNQTFYDPFTRAVLGLAERALRSEEKQAEQSWRESEALFPLAAG